MLVCSSFSNGGDHGGIRHRGTDASSTSGIGVERRRILWICGSRVDFASAGGMGQVVHSSCTGESRPVFVHTIVSASSNSDLSITVNFGSASKSAVRTWLDDIAHDELLSEVVK